jgi:hypothetical protein
MSVLDALDATRICERWTASAPQPIPVPIRPRVPVPAPVRYSWWTLVRNPQALLVTGLVGTMLATDASLRAVATAAARRTA